MNISFQDEPDAWWCERDAWDSYPKQISIQIWTKDSKKDSLQYLDVNDVL